MGIHTDQRNILIERVHRHLERGEVRIQDDDFFPCRQRVVQIMFVAVAHQ